MCVAYGHILFRLWDCFKKKNNKVVWFFFVFDPTLKNRKVSYKNQLSTSLEKAERSGDTGPQQQALEFGLPPPFVSLAPIHRYAPPPTPVCDHLSLAPRGQGSAEQQERANTRARGSRITMFHYQPKPLELCFLNSNQKFLKTSTWTVLVHITQSSDWKHMESERKLLQLIWLGTSGQLCCLSLSLRQQDWLLSYSSLPVCRGEGAEKFF